MWTVSIDYGWRYLSTTGAYPNFDPTYAGNTTLNESCPGSGNGTAITCMTSLYTSDTTGANGRLTIPGIDNYSGNGGIVDYAGAVGSAGFRDRVTT